MSELLAPAGNIESLDAAIGEGADAVYLGLKSFNARLRTSNFAWNQFEAAVDAVHRQGKKIYVTVNTVCEESETERLYRFLSYLNNVKPDGLIVQDFAIIRMAQQFFPEMELHASTQMNIASAAGVNLLSREGVKRVVLARELGLEEIKKIKDSTKTQLEIFVHGALCVSESGLCLFSSFLGGKSANRGMCTQACRRFYTAELPDGVEQGYYFSPCDLELINRIPDLMEIGIDSFKIEGRMKSAEYVGAVVSAYRYVMDHWKEDKKGAVVAGKRMLSSDFARTKTSYWYNFKTQEDGIEKAGDEILNPDQAGGTGIYLGTITSLKAAPDELIEDAKKNASSDTPPEQLQIQMAQFSGESYDPDPGDSIRLHRKDDSGRVSHKVRSVEIPESGKRWIDIPGGFHTGDSVYLLQTKSMSKHYPRVLPNDLSRYRRQPADEKLPVLDLTPVKKNELTYFPEGLYVQVSTLSDVFIVQAAHPVRVIIELNHETGVGLLQHNTVLPLSKKQLIISLDPYCPAASEDLLRGTIDDLIADGFTTFVANNTAHIEMLRGRTGVNMIAGPYLYTFNRWAVSWLENQGLGAFVMPYENSRKNLESTFEQPVRSRVLIPVFAYPALFRMRFKLPDEYDFTYFKDKEGGTFKVNSTVDGSFVMPETAFAITDKTDLLYNSGFRRLLLDFSKTKVTKGQLREVTNSIVKRAALPGVSRFNWKEGFYSPQQVEEYKAGNERAAAARIAGNDAGVFHKKTENSRKGSTRGSRKRPR
ncbi:MAG: U32 family peptidase [Treponema sp.]|nr:U32 family peptidase [Treponema sp.]